MFLVITYYICTLHTHTNIHLYPIAFDYWFESHNCRSVCSLNCSRRIKSQSTQTLAHIHMYVRCIYIHTFIDLCCKCIYLRTYIFVFVPSCKYIYTLFLLFFLIYVYAYNCLASQTIIDWLSLSLENTLRGTRYCPQTLIIDQYLPCNNY